MPVELRPQPVESQTPMVLEVSRAELLTFVNDQLRNQGPSYGQIPDHADITIHIPGGGDYSGEDISFDKIVFRWKK